MKLNLFFKRGFLIAFGDAPYDHKLGGRHEIPGGYCQSCRKPLLRMATIDMADKRLRFLQPQYFKNEISIEPRGKRLTVQTPHLLEFPLLFCWTCEKASWFSYRLNHHLGVDVLNNEPGEPKKGFPYKNYPVAFPERRVKLVPLPPKAQELIRLVNARKMDEIGYKGPYREILVPRHQIGGEPYLVQGSKPDRDVRCSLCKRVIPLLAAIADDTGTAKGFTGNSYVQVLFHYCVRCGVIEAYNECD